MKQIKNKTLILECFLVWLLREKLELGSLFTAICVNKNDRPKQTTKKKN